MSNPHGHINQIIAAHWNANRDSILQAMSAPNPRMAHIHWSAARHHQQAVILYGIGEIRDRLIVELSTMLEMSQNYPDMSSYISRTMNIVFELDQIGQRPEPPPLNPHQT